MIVTCKLCRKLYNGEGRICPECRQRLDELYPEVRDYLRDNHKLEFNVETVAEALDVDIRYVQELVAQGYLDRDLPEGVSSEVLSDRQKLIKAFESSIDKMKADAAVAASRKSVTYGQEIYGENTKRR
ncbi:MAG: hypothetical protein K5841_02170 [Fretibacterium sp.]|nr:hypothetical protein [Fretibacterium sp.]